MDLQQTLFDKSKSVEFRRTIGVLEATTIGVGSLMGAGLYVLVGIAAAQAGPGVWLAYAVCGVLTFLSVLMYGELGRRLPISGGGYIYAYRTLGSFWGFTVGWHLAVGSIFACALYAYGFASYLGSLLPGSIGGEAWLQKLIAVALVALLIVLGARGGRGGDRLQRLFTWGNLVILLVLALVALSYSRASRLVPLMPNGLGGVGAAISLIYISFFGYQLIANSAEEIQDAPRTIPRAMLYSMLIASFFYLLIAVVCLAAVDWTELARSDTPLVLVASRGIGTLGVLLVGVGGILASGAALNGTLLSQGRQIYAMGRDRLLPELVSRVDEQTKVPRAALFAGAAATILVILFASVSFTAKAANFALLFSMLPISVALHRLLHGRSDDESGEPGADRDASMRRESVVSALPTQRESRAGVLPTADPSSAAAPIADASSAAAPIADASSAAAPTQRESRAGVLPTVGASGLLPPPVPLWLRALPWAALAANLALLLTLDIQTLLFGGTVIGAGCFVFIIYSYSSEKRGQAGFSVDLAGEEESPLAFLTRGERILVPMANPRTQESLFSISQALLSANGGEIVVLSVVRAEQGRTP
ncbi:MAG: amino acid permease, partial [Myxococcales bacterium]|nr:amino acid permease [Myxococcales bacterium]